MKLYTIGDRPDLILFNSTIIFSCIQRKIRALFATVLLSLFFSTSNAVIDTQTLLPIDYADVPLRFKAAGYDQNTGIATWKANSINNSGDTLTGPFYLEITGITPVEDNVIPIDYDDISDNGHPVFIINDAELLDREVWLIYYQFDNMTLEGRGLRKYRIQHQLYQTPPNQAPIADNQTINTNEDSAVSIILTASDNDGDNLTYSITQQPANGSLTGTAPNLTYTPNTNYTGVDSFSFIANDSIVDSNTAVINITINATNTAPVANNQAIALDEDSNIAITLIANDSDGDTLTYTINQQPNNGVLTGTAPNLTYTPNQNFNGNDSFSFIANDGQENSNIATVSITINPANDLPTANSQTITTPEDTPVAITLTGSDIDGDTLTYAIITQPTIGTLTGTVPNLSYTPNANFNGNDNFTFTVNDGMGNSQIATINITVNPTNDAPIAQGQSLTTDEDTAANITLTASDSEGDTLSYSITQQPVNGVLSGVAPDVFYTPNANFTGNDSFSFIANDGATDSNLATINITVNPVNDAPVINITSPNNDMLIFTEADNITFSATATDIEDGDISAQIQWSAMPGFNNLGNGASFIRTLPVGSYIVAAQITDSANATVSETLNIQIVPNNVAPIANNITVQTTVNQAITFVLDGTDFNNDPLSYSLDNTTTSGTATLDNGQVTYTPNTNFIGHDQLTYSVNDGTIDSNVAIVTINVVNVNDIPEITSQPVLVGIEGEPYNYDVEASDPNSLALTYSLVEAPVGMTINATTGLVEWVDTIRGEYPVTVQVTNTNEVSVQQSYTLLITSPLPPVTHEGTEFWFSYFQNADGLGGISFGNDSPPEQRLLYISSKTDANITLEIPETGFIQSYQALSEQVLTIDMTNVTETGTGGLDFDSLGMESFGNGIHISSDVPVVAYFISKTRFSTDASTIYPTDALGSNYSIATYAENSTLGSSNIINQFPSLFGIVATEDNTNITVVPTVPTFDYQINQPYQITLNRGQSYQLLSPSGNPEVTYNGRDEQDYVDMDFSGTKIQSDKPIAVFSGHNCAHVGKTGACDHLIEQSLPVESLGTTYLTVPLATRINGDTVRVYAVEDNTVIKIDGDIVSFLQTGEYYTHYLVTEPSVIKADKPIQVMQFSNSCRVDTPPGSFIACPVKADPFMSAVPTVEQYLSYYQVTTPSDGFETHFINLIVEDEVKDSVRLDGHSIDESLWISIVGTNYVGAQVPVDAGAHVAYASKPFGLMIYGFNDFDSYGYIGGSAFPENKAVSQIITSVDESNPSVGEDVCINAILLDSQLEHITQQQVRFTVENNILLNSKYHTGLTNNAGEVQYCYKRGAVSLDTVTIESGLVSEIVQVNWQAYTDSQNLPPIIESFPDPYVTDEDTVFNYQIVAYDPNGDSLIYRFTRSLSSRYFIDTQTGFMRYTLSNFTRAGDMISIPVEVCDTSNACVTQNVLIRIESSASTAQMVPNIQNTVLDFDFQNGHVGIDFRANDDNILEIFRWNLLKSPFGSSLGYYTSNFTWPDAEVTNPGLITHHNQYCLSSDSTIRDFDIKTKWIKQDAPNRQSLVGYLYDSNQDGLLDQNDRKVIIGIQSDPPFGRKVIAIDAITGQEIWRRNDLQPSLNSVGALIDLDNDANSEFIFIQHDTNKLVALNFDGSTRWISDSVLGEGFSNIGYSNGIIPTDLNNDGEYELLVAGSVFDMRGELLWQFSRGSRYYSSRAYDGNTIAIDLDNDGYQEVIFSDQVRDWQGNLLWEIPFEHSENIRASKVAAANLDNDPELEIAINSFTRGSRHYITVIDHDGDLLWEQRLDQNGAYGNIIFSDLNNDSQIDIYLSAANSAYDVNGNILWLGEAPFDNTNAMIADINADGYLEILRYKDRYSFAIYDAATGESLRTISIDNTREGGQVPAFIDIDNDQKGEIFLGGSSLFGSDLTRALESINDDWYQTSQVYAYENQAFNAVDTSMRLTNAATTYAGQINQAAPVTNASLGRLSDLAIEYVRVNADRDLDQWQVEFKIINKGMLNVAAGAILEFYRDDPAVSSNKFGELVLPQINIEASYKDFYTFNDFALMGDEIFAVIKLPNIIQECSLINNIASAKVVGVQVTDNDGLSDSEYWAIGLTDRVSAPEFTSTPITDASVNSPYIYQARAEDVNTGDILRYYLTTAPYGMSIDSVSGLVTWEPAYTQVGNHTVEIRVEDLNTQSSVGITQRFTINVVSNSSAGANQFPLITSAPIFIAEINKLYSYDVKASDPEGSYIVYELITAPGDMTINRLSGELRWTPTVADAGNHDIVIRAIDTYGLNFEQSYTLLVRGNAAPVIDPIADGISVINQVYNIAVTATDPDGDPLTYSLVDAPTGMTIDAQTGVINWSPIATDLGNYNITVQATDQLGLSVEQTYALLVRNNVAPTMNSITANQVIAGRNYIVNIEASDADGDAINYGLINSPTGMVIDELTGVINWSPQIADIGSYTISVSAVDTLGAGIGQSYSLVVTENQLPVITPINPVNTFADANYNYNIIASDPDDDTISYSLTTAPAGMSIDASGLITWIPTTAQTGDNTVTVSVDDGFGGISAANYIITVAAVNQAPTITSTPNTSVLENRLYTYTVTATDPEETALSYTLDTAPIGMTINPSTGVINWVPNDTQIGLNNVIVRATDADGGFATQSYSIDVTVDNINEPPLITSETIRLADEGVLYSYDVDATDINNDTLTYSLDIAPVAMTINSATGLINWIPVNTQVGLNNVTVRVEDGNGGGATQSFSINVISATLNQTPEINSQPILTASVANLYQYTIDASDVENDPLVYTLITGPTGMTMATNGVITWTPAATQLGSYNVAVRVSDAESFSQQQFTLQVTDDPVPFRVLVQADPQILELGETTTITVATTGGIDSIVTSLSINGVDIPLDSTGQATFTGNAFGTYDMIATATDSIRTVATEAFFSVRDPSDVIPPVAAINNPTANTEITAPVDIIGTASDINLLDYKLYVSPAGQNNYTEIASGETSVENNVLGQFDPTMLVNGQYEVLLSVRDNNGQETQALTTYTVSGDFKVGEFSFTIEDMTIPAAGLPISVRRTYDSRRRMESGDFGYGWNLDINTGDVHTNRALGEGWVQYQAGVGFAPYCIDPIGEAPRITITLPDGEVETFEGSIEPRCEGLTPRTFVNMVFRSVGDTNSTLTVPGASGLTIAGDILLNNTLTNTFNPNAYILTQRDGIKVHYDKDAGVERIEEPNGNAITISSNGIQHTSGLNVSFIRDGEGRISQITDPKGNSIDYSYNNNGDLISVTERDGTETTYTYYGGNCNTAFAGEDCHLLDQIIDPLGRALIKSIYDEDGRLIAQEDQDGNRTEFNHDIAGQQTVITDRNGRVTVMFYDERGNVTHIIDALGNTKTYTYDARDNQLTETDELGNISTATYNINDDQMTQLDELGNQLSFQYNQFGQETRITDSRGNVSINSYDNKANLRSVADPEANLASNVVNTQGLPTSETDALGHTTTYTYDSEGNKLTETDPNGTLTSWTYDNNNNMLTETKTRTVAGTLVNETTSYVYDERNRLIQTTDALGNITQTEYDAAGNESAQIDALGRRTEFVYDAYNNLLQTTYPDGTTEINTYDAENNKLSSTDRLGRVTTYEYDALNRQVRTTYPDGSFIQTVYDDTGRISAEIDELGNRTEHSYDAAGRRISTTDALGNITRFTYDTDGNQTSMTDANSNTMLYTYNNLDQRIQTDFDDGTTLQEEHDALNRRTRMIDQLGRVTRYNYDALGRLTTVEKTDVAGYRTSYTFDEQSNKLTQRDAAGRVTRWTYDALGRVTSRTLPMGQTEYFGYDANGNLICYIDFNAQANASAAGAGCVGAINDKTTHTYDINDRLIQSDYPDGSQETFAYDAEGNRTEATISDSDGTRTWTYEYDNRNRLVEEVKPTGAILNYTYDTANNKLSLSHRINDVATPLITSYSYDILNRLQTVTNHSGGITTYSYDAVGNRSSIQYSNGLSTEYTYDNLNRLTQVSHKNGLTTVKEFNYTLDNTGRRTQITEDTGRVTTYTYDALYRLTNEVASGGGISTHRGLYAYDITGNRITERLNNGAFWNFEYDNNDRLVLYRGNRTITYDDNGNTITAPFISNMVYNSQNELISVERTNNTTTNYQYNADGIRTQKTVIASGTTQLIDYLLDHNRAYAQVLQEQQSGAATVTYTYGDDLLSQDRAGVLHTYLYDGLGSTRALVDATGILSDTYSYNAFGNIVNSTGTTENNYLFTGEQFDDSLEQYYLRARYYNQEIGRFTQQDTWLGDNHDPVTLHKYLYANVDPANMIDPSGNASIPEISFSLAISRTISLSRAALGKTLIVSFRTGRSVAHTIKREVTVCRKTKGKKCRIPNLVVIGSIHDEAQQHIDDTILGRGSNGIPVFPRLTYKKGGHSRSFLRSAPECKGKVGLTTGKDCDEWPFNTTSNGGRSGYKNKQVSLRPIDSSDNQLSGQVWGRAVRQGENGAKYFVVPYGPISFYFSHGKFGF